MARNKSRPKRKYVSVKIDAEVYRLVRTVAAYRDQAIGDYLSEITEPAVRRDVARMNRELGQLPETEPPD